MRFLVTGGAGFIGSALLHHLIRGTGHEALCVDKLTYAGNRESLAALEGEPRFRFLKADICDGEAMTAALAEFRPDIVLHLAAESHVDRSLDGPAPFMETNILGSFTLLRCALSHWRGLEGEEKSRFRFHHVSTDEVFGALGEDGAFTEDSPYRPNSPYAASKAASDHLARAWHRSYGLPVVMSNCSNNYGPRQFPEKFIPLAILAGLEGRDIPVYGGGENVRDWLHVEDHAEALLLIASRGRAGESYNVGGGAEMRNIDVAREICRLLDARRPLADGASHERLIRFVPDRPGHDFRYAVDCGKLSSELGWKPRHSFKEGLEETVEWYLANEGWWRRIRDGSYRGERLGLAGAP
jgi:dTDP-glucose 4,6-dehydratase